LANRKYQFRDDVSVFMVLELEHRPRGPHAGITVLLSVPGRDGTFERTWHATNGLLDGLEVEDMIAWIALSSRHALQRWTGVQEVLPME
jgi:hypothetical protein